MALLTWWVMANTWQDSFYKVLSPEEHEKAFRSEFDFDAPDAIGFDILVDRLRELKKG